MKYVPFVSPLLIFICWFVFGAALKAFLIVCMNLKIDVARFFKKKLVQGRLGQKVPKWSQNF